MKNNYTPLDSKTLKNFFYSSSTSVETEPPKEHLIIEEKTEFEPEKEVRPYITVKKESIKLPTDLKKIGVKATPSLKTLVYQKVQLPISDEKIISGLHAPITSSLRWLATLAVYLLKLAHLQLKVVHGKVIRVFKS